MKLPTGQRRYDIGNFNSYFRSFIDFAFADPEYGEAIRAHARTRLDPEE